MAYDPATQSELEYGDQTQSQPVLPSQQSRYFHYAFSDHSASQGRSRLSPLPRMSYSPMTVGSPRVPMPPFPSRRQPYPLYVRGPAAMGYIPQQPIGYSTRFGRQDPIVPLRKEFSTMNGIDDQGERLVSPGLIQHRPYSVPLHYPQTSRPSTENFVTAITRPTNLVDDGDQWPKANSLSRMNPGDPMPSLPRKDVTHNQSTEEDPMPPKRILPFPTSNHLNRPATLESDPKSSSMKSSTPKKTPTSSQQVNHSVIKSTLADKIDHKRRVSHHLPENPHEPPKEDGKRRSQRLKGAVANKTQSCQRPTKIRLVGRHSTDASNTSQHDSNTFVAISKQVDEGPYRQPKLLQKPFENPPHDKNRGIRGLNPNVTGVKVSQDTHRSRASGLSELLSTERYQDTEATDNSAICNPALGSSHSALVSRRLSGYRNPTPNFPFTQEQPFPECAGAHKRSASQATTVSSTSEDESKLNDVLSSIDVPTFAKQNIGDIVSTCLQTGGDIEDSLDAAYAAVLIKLAVKDEARFEFAKKVLQISSSRS